LGSNWNSHGTNQKTADSDSFKETDIYSYIRKQYKESRGTELPGHVNPSLLQRLFYEQSRKWETISTEHVSKVWNFVSEGHHVILSQLCKLDGTTLNHLNHSFDSEWEASMQRAKRVLQSILIDERSGPLLTQDDKFTRNLSTARTNRIFS
jgi:hypothetical protein